MFFYIHTWNIKSLAFSALVAISTFGGSAVQAAPTTCALRTSSDLEKFTCDHIVRVNANGHKVNDITFFDGNKRYDFSVIYWMNDDNTHNYAEVFYNGDRTPMTSYTAKNGAWCVSNNATQLCVH